MYQVMFFNQHSRLVFGENREGKYLSPCGSLLDTNNGFPNAITEFDSFEEAEKFSHTVLEKFNSDLLRATIRDSDRDEYSQIK